MAAIDPSQILGLLRFTSLKGQKRFFSRLGKDTQRLYKEKLRHNLDHESGFDVLSVKAAQRDRLIECISDPKIDGTCVTCTVTDEGGLLGRQGSKVSVRETSSNRFSARRLKASFESALEEYLQHQQVLEPRVVLDVTQMRGLQKVGIRCESPNADRHIKAACKGLFFIPNDFDPSNVHMGFKALSTWMTFLKYDAPHIKLPINDELRVMSGFNTWLLAGEGGEKSQFQKGKHFFLGYFKAESKVDYFKTLFETYLKEVGASESLFNLEKGVANRDESQRILSRERKLLQKQYAEANGSSKAKRHFESALKRYVLKHHVADALSKCSPSERDSVARLNTDISEIIESYSEKGAADTITEFDTLKCRITEHPPETFIECKRIAHDLLRIQQEFETRHRTLTQQLNLVGLEGDDQLLSEFDHLNATVSEALRSAMNEMSDREFTGFNRALERLESMSLLPTDDEDESKNVGACQSNIEMLTRMKDTISGWHVDFCRHFKGHDLDSKEVTLLMELIDSSRKELLFLNPIEELEGALDAQIDRLKTLESGILNALNRDQDDVGKAVAFYMECENKLGKGLTESRFFLTDDASYTAKVEAYIEHARSLHNTPLTQKEIKKLRVKVRSFETTLEAAHVLRYESPISQFREPFLSLYKLKDKEASLLSDSFRLSLETLIQNVEEQFGDVMCDGDALTQFRDALVDIYDTVHPKGGAVSVKEVPRLLDSVSSIFRDQFRKDGETGKVIESQIQNAKALIKTAKLFMREASLEKVREYYDEPKYWDKYTYINEGVILEPSGEAFKALNGRIGTVGAAYASMTRSESEGKSVNKLESLARELRKLVPKMHQKISESSDRADDLDGDDGLKAKYTRLMIRHVKHFAKQATVYIKANEGAEDSKKKAITLLKHILKFEGIDQAWGISIVTAALKSEPVVGLLKLAGADSSRPPQYMTSLQETLRDHYDDNPYETLVHNTDAIFQRVQSSDMSKSVTSFKTFVDFILNMSKGFHDKRSGEEIGVKQFDDPLLLKSRLQIVKQVIAKSGLEVFEPTETGSKKKTVHLDPADPSFPEARLLMGTLSVVLTPDSLTVLNDIADLLELGIQSIGLRGIIPDELNRLSLSETELRGIYGAHILNSQYYSFKYVMESIAELVRKVPTKHGNELVSIFETLEPEPQVLDVDRVVEGGKVFAKKSALIATRELFDSRPLIELSPDDSHDQSVTSGTIAHLKAYRTRVKTLLYDLTEYKVGYISPKTIWRAVLEPYGTPLEQRPLIRGLEEDSKFSLLRLMYEYTVTSQLLYQLGGAMQIEDAEEVPFLKGISPNFYTKHSWAMPLMPDAKYPGQVEDLTGIVTELIKKAIQPKDPIVFSAKQLAGIMKFHHAQQSSQNGQSITAKWICSTGGGKTTLAQHMADLFRSHIIIVSPIYVEGSIELTEASFLDGKLELGAIITEPTTFYINARTLREIFEKNGNRLDLTGVKVVFDEFDKADVYGPLIEAVEGVSEKERRIESDAVLKMSATSELSTLVLEQVTTNYKSIKLKKNSHDLMLHLISLAQNPKILDVLANYFNNIPERLAVVNALVENNDWEHLVSECLQFEKDEIQQFNTSPIDRLDQDTSGELMREFLNLLVMFRNSHEALNRNINASQSATDDVFETMTRVKRHFSDTKINVKQVEFSGNNPEKVTRQFRSIVRDVLTSDITEGVGRKNVSLIEDFFLTFDRPDSQSVQISQEDLFRMVQSGLIEGQECRLAFMDNHSQKVIYTLTKHDAVKFEKSVMSDAETRAYDGHIIVLYKRDEERGVDWPMSRVKHVKMTAGVPPESLFKLIPALQWMGRLRGVDEKVVRGDGSQDAFVALPNLDLYLEKETLHKIASAVSVKPDLVDWCFSVKAELPESLAKDYIDILMQAPKKDDDGSRELFREKITKIPGNFKQRFLQTIVTQFLFIQYADQSVTTVRDYIREEEHDQFETNLVKGYYEWVKNEKVRLMRDVLSENMMSLKEDVKMSLFGAFDSLMGLDRKALKAPGMAQISKDVLRSRDIILESLEDTLTHDGRVLTKDVLVKYSRKQWDRIFRLLWEGSLDRTVKSRKEDFLTIAKELIEKSQKKLDSRDHFKAEKAEENLVNLQENSMQILPGLNGVEATRTLLTIISQATWENVPPSLQRLVAPSERPFLELVFKEYSSRGSSTYWIPNRLSIILAKKELRVLSLKKSGKLRLAPLKGIGKKLDDILSEHKFHGFKISPPTFLWEKTFDSVTNEKTPAKLRKWYLSNGRLPTLLANAGYQLYGAEKTNGLELVSLEIYKSKRRESSRFDEAKYQLLREKVLKACGQGVATAVDEHVAKNYALRVKTVDKKGGIKYSLPVKSKFDATWFSSENKSLVDQYLAEAINKAKFESVLEAAKIYWEYLVRETYHFGFECCALKAVGQHIAEQSSIPSVIESCATPLRGAGASVVSDFPRVPQTGKYFGPPLTVSRSGSRSEMELEEKDDHRQLQAQEQLRLSVEIYKSAQPFSIILLQLYVQLVRFDHSNIESVRALLEQYMDMTHHELGPLIELKASVLQQSRWMEELARKLRDFVKEKVVSEDNRLKKYQELLQFFAKEKCKEVSRRRRLSDAALPPRPERAIRTGRTIRPLLARQAWRSPDTSPIKELNQDPDDYRVDDTDDSATIGVREGSFFGASPLTAATSDSYE